MVQLIKKPEVRILTKQGECNVSITLDLNINLNSDGLSVNVSNSEVTAKQKQEDDEVKWAIPDFSNEQIKFGKEQE